MWRGSYSIDRGGDLSMDLNITLEYTGDAVYGIEELPTELTLPAFEEQIVLPIEVFFDNIVEGQEVLNITISGVPVACEETTVQTIEIIILDQDLLVVDMPNEINMNCTGSALIEASVQGGYPPYNYVWYDESGVIIDSGELNEEGVLTIEQVPSESTSYTLSVTDDCLDQLFEASTNVIVEDEILNVSLDNQPEEIVICEQDLANIVLEPIISGGFLPYNYTWFYNGVVISNQEVLNELPGEGLYQLVVEEEVVVLTRIRLMFHLLNLHPM